MNKTLKQLIEKIEKEMQNKNNYDQPCNIDIPFCLSSLIQRFEKETDELQGFIEDLQWNDYFVVVSDIVRNTWNGIADFEVVFPERNFKYIIQFEYEKRHWGYCQCDESMEGYREDKGCCGHECDWNAPSFTIEKVSHIYSDSWCGDQHDYWDFEDEFYSRSNESKELKLKREKEEEIKRLKESIEEIQKKLKELEE